MSIVTHKVTFSGVCHGLQHSGRYLLSNFEHIIIIIITGRHTVGGVYTGCQINELPVRRKALEIVRKINF